MPYTTKAVRHVTAKFAWLFAFLAQTATGAITLKVTDAERQVIDPGGSTRVVTLPTCTVEHYGLTFDIENSADANGELLTINKPASTTLASLSPGESATFLCGSDGVWAQFGAKRSPGFSHEIADPGNAGAIPVTRSGRCAIVTAGSETRTLADPTFEGQELLIYVLTDGGTCVITAATAINQTGNNTITMADALDVLDLVGIRGTVAGLVWRVRSSDGSALSTV